MFLVELLTADDQFPIRPTSKRSKKLYCRGKGLWRTLKAAEDWVNTLKKLPVDGTSRTFIIKEIEIVG